MKKSLLMKTMLLLWALIVGSSSVWAAEETVTFSDVYSDKDKPTSYTGTNFTLTYNKEFGSNAPQYYNTGSALRLYAQNTMVVSSEKTIEKIVLTFGTGDGSNDITTNVGTYQKSGTWEGSANSVTFTIGGSKGNRRIASVTVTYSAGGGGDTPTTYSVTYDANGATSGDVPTDENKYEKDAVVTVLGNTGSLAKTGCAFGGWNTQANGEGDYYDENATFNISANTTLYAMWTPYTITALTNNESYGTVSLNGSVITATPATGYTYASPAYTVDPANSAEVVQDGNTFTVTPTADTEVTINFESLPTHTATFSVNGVASSQDYKEGEAITFPENPSDIDEKTFVGWTATAIDGTTDEAPDFVTSAKMGQNDVTYYAVFANARDVQNIALEITATTDGVPSSYGTANKFSEYTMGGVKFQIMQMYKSGGKLQWRAAGNSNGTGTMYNDESLGKITSVVLTYNSSDSNKNFTLKVGNSKNPTEGTDISPTVNVNGMEYTFDCSTANYGYFVLTNGSNAGYLDKVVINYSSSSVTGYCTTVVADTKQEPELSFSPTELNVTIGEDFTLPTLNAAEGFNGTVEYSSSDESVAMIEDSEEGTLRLMKEGTTTITATFDGNENFKSGSASYTLTVTDNRITTTITQEDIVLNVLEVATLTQLNPVVKDADGKNIPYEFSEFLSIVSFELVSGDDIFSDIDYNKGQITLSGNVGTATLKAYYNRFNGDTTYKPSECTFTITVVPTISEVRSQSTSSVVTTKGIVTSCSGTTAYIQDATAAICVYGSALTVGDEVKVEGTLKDYNGLLEITTPTVTVLSQNNTVTPEVMTIAKINASDNQGWLVKIKDATVTAISGLNTTIAQGDNTIVVRGISDDISVNDVITLTGNIGCYNVAQIANPTDVAVTGVTITLVEACHNSENIYYGTYSNANAFIVPDDLTVAEVGIYNESDKNKLTVETYKTGDIVPANTGVVVSSATAGAHVVLFSTGGTSVMSNSNCLRATGNEGITAATMDVNDVDCVFYRLTMHNKTDLGFYWGAEDGAAFAVAANKAYLAVPKSAGARIQGFSFDGDTITGISQIENGKSEVENYFDLQGRSIANPAKGLYIKNGKKVVIR